MTASSTPAPAPDEYPGFLPGRERKVFHESGYVGWELGGACQILHLAGDLSAAIYAVAKVEGSYDNVQTYDDGVLTFGILQWTIHAGSLQRLLYHLKYEAGPDGAAAFAEYFQCHGIDIPPLAGKGDRPQISHLGVVYAGKEQWHPVIRASRESAEEWCTWFNAAGKDPRVQRVQFAHARQQLLDLQGVDLEGKVRSAKEKCPQTFFAANVGRYGLAGQWTRESPKAALLHFSMCVNNPLYGHAALLKAIDATCEANRAFGSAPEQWPAAWAATFGDLLEAKCKETLPKTWANHLRDNKTIEGRTEKTLRYWAAALALNH